MNELLERHRQEFHDEEARYASAEAYMNAFVAAQLRAIREDRGLSQEELAEMIGTKQSGISRLESMNYSAWKTETLRKLARALGVRMKISFEEFGTLWSDVTNFNRESLVKRKFEDDPAFQQVVEQPRPGEAVAETPITIDPTAVPPKSIVRGSVEAVQQYPEMSGVFSSSAAGAWRHMVDSIFQEGGRYFTDVAEIGAMATGAKLTNPGDASSPATGERSLRLIPNRPAASSAVTRAENPTDSPGRQVMKKPAA